MVETEKLDEIILRENIIKKFAALPEKTLGYYSFDGTYRIILLNKNIKTNAKIYRAVLAEEIGHYITTVGDITPTCHTNYEYKLIIDKKELAAIKWAIDFLVPTEELLEVIRLKCIQNIYDLADMFYVTEDLLLKKFEFMAKLKPIWDLDDRRYLYLYKLPSIFIFEKFPLNNL